MPQVFITCMNFHHPIINQSYCVWSLGHTGVQYRWMFLPDSVTRLLAALSCSSVSWHHCHGGDEELWWWWWWYDDDGLTHHSRSRGRPHSHRWSPVGCWVLRYLIMTIINMIIFILVIIKFIFWPQAKSAMRSISQLLGRNSPIPMWSATHCTRSEKGAISWTTIYSKPIFKMFETKPDGTVRVNITITKITIVIKCWIWPTLMGLCMWSTKAIGARRTASSTFGMY